LNFEIWSYCTDCTGCTVFSTQMLGDDDD
jgi:hypothetical protein